MLFKPSRRKQRRWTSRVALLFTAVIILDVFFALRGHRTFQQNLLSQTVVSHESLPRVVQQQKIFIAAQFWTSEHLLKNHWIDAFIRLVQVLGPENVYVSIISNHGLDDTEDAVRLLDSRLNELDVSRTVLLDPSTHTDALYAESFGPNSVRQPGWVSITNETSKKVSKARRRIPYLSGIRNRALEQLQGLKRDTSPNITFDRILFLNDVVFEPADILTLLATNKGHFDVACGLDYHQPPLLYDSFAARDASYRGPITSVFPYFVSPATQQAMLAGLPAPVTSCWNGVIAVDAAPYYDQILPGKPEPKIQKGLRFRGIPDSLAEYYLEASECCAQKGMYINPAVRTAYVAHAYNATHFGPRGSNFVSAWQYWSGIWVVRFRRWWKDAVSISAGQNMPEVYRRIRHWEQQGGEQTEASPRMEVGGYCTILEMQLLLANGWKHITKDIGKLEMRKP